MSAGSKIEGTVINSIIAPGVIVEEGATVNNSIIFDDCVIKKGATVDLAILDKRVTVGEGAVIGHGENLKEANHLKPSHLYTGITLVGKGAEVPANQKVGRNCVISGGVKQTAYPTTSLEDGETLFPNGEVS